MGFDRLVTFFRESERGKCSSEVRFAGKRRARKYAWQLVGARWAGRRGDGRGVSSVKREACMQLACMHSFETGRRGKGSSWNAGGIQDRSMHVRAHMATVVSRVTCQRGSMHAALRTGSTCSRRKASCWMASRRAGLPTRTGRRASCRYLISMRDFAARQLNP